MVVGGALARMALGFDGAIPLNRASTYPGAHSVNDCAGPLDRRIDQPGPEDGNTRLRRILVRWHFLPQKRRRIRGSTDLSPDWMSRTADGPADLDYGVPFSKLNCACSYPPPWGGWLFLQPASLFNFMQVISHLRSK